MINENELIPYKEAVIPEGKYLVFAPHPDDETLGMGGTIALATSRGFPVTLVFMTNGDMGGNPDIRQEEARQAAEILGIDRIFHLNLGDRRVCSESLPEALLDEILTTTEPDLLFLPSFQEIHPDHRATTQKILAFLKKRGYHFDLWFYEVNRQGEVNRVIDIASVLDLKESAIECYASQIEQLDYKEHALCLNFMRSITLGGKSSYAEGFWCHDAGDSMDPERYYFSHVFKYIPSGQPIELISDLSERADLHTKLRRLKDRVNSQAATIAEWFCLSTELSRYINERTDEIRELKEINKTNQYIISMLEERVSNIALSRSHRLASAYIKSVMELRLFFRNLKSKKGSWRKRHLKNSNSGDQSSFSEERVRSQDSELDELNRELMPVSISDGEPLIRLYGEDEFDKNVHEHDIYIESTTYGNKKILPLVDNRPVAFSIECVKRNLSRIDLFMGTFMRVNPGVLVLSLYQESDESNEKGDKRPLRICEVLSAGVVDNRFVSFNFEPVEDSYEKRFNITLSLKHGCDERCPGLWIQPDPNMSSIERYHQWIAKNEQLSQIDNSLEHKHSSESGEMEFIPLPDGEQSDIAVIVPLFNTDMGSQRGHATLPLQPSYLNMLTETVESVVNQSFKNWKMVIIDTLTSSSGLHQSYLESSESEKFLTHYIKEIALKSERITVHESLNENLSTALNRAIELAECRYFLLLDAYDTISSDALHECAKVISRFPDTDLIYSDEDKISEDGVRSDPFFKPDWSPDLLLSCMYIGNFTLYRKELFQKGGGYTTASATCREYDALLKLSELTEKIRHIPRVLYHRRGLHSDIVTPASRVQICSESAKAKEAIGEALKRRGIEAEIHEGLTEHSFRVSRRFDQHTYVSIIIPFRDNHEVLETCIQSIVQKTQYKNYEIILVNNQSRKQETALFLSHLESLPGMNLTLLDYDKPFNYSAINNYAATCSKGSVLLFLNSDTEVISGQWLNAMLEHACRNEVGAVGAKLYYVNDTIQHAGVVVGIAGLAGHAFKHVNRYETEFYHGFPSVVRNVSAVTGACMMVRRSVFEEVGGFDEELFKVSYNDLDLCMKIGERGYSVIYTPFAELYHYESYSRGYCFDPVATENLKAKWGRSVECDPFYNPNLSIFKEDWSLE